MGIRLSPRRRSLPMPEDYVGVGGKWAFRALASRFGTRIEFLKIALVGAGIYAIQLERQREEETINSGNPRLMLEPTTEALANGWIAGPVHLTDAGVARLKEHIMGKREEQPA